MTCRNSALGLIAGVGLLLGQSSQEQQGVRFDVRLEGVAGGAARAGESSDLVLSLQDVLTGKPLTGVHPMAWLVERQSEITSTETDCATKIRPLLSGQLSTQPAVDFNAFSLATLDEEGSVSFFNPLVDFRRSRLEAIVPLPGVGMDWAISLDGKTMLVTLPAQKSIAWIDVKTRKLLDVLRLKQLGRPTRILMDPRGDLAWVGLDGASQVVSLDVRARKVTGEITVGKGLHALSASTEGRYLAVTNSDSGTVTIVDAETRKATAEISVGLTPVPVAFGQASGYFYVSALNANVVTVINPATGKKVGTVALSAGVTALAFEPDGRYLWAVNPIRGQVTVIDSAVGRIVAQAKLEDEPDQIWFSDHFAYVRRAKANKIQLFGLDHKGGQSLADIEINVSQNPPKVPSVPGVATMGAVSPHGDASFIANSGDHSLALYTEGMMAPMGSFDTAGRTPRGILMLDQSLREVEPGQFRAAAQIPWGGRFDVAVAVDNPRASYCVPFNVEGPSAPVSGAARFEGFSAALLANDSLVQGAPASIRFVVKDSNGAAVSGLTGLRVVSFALPGADRKQKSAKATGEGYEVSLTFAGVGTYRLVVMAEESGHTHIWPLGDLKIGDK